MTVAEGIGRDVARKLIENGVERLASCRHGLTEKVIGQLAGNRLENVSVSDAGQVIRYEISDSLSRAA